MERKEIEQVVALMHALELASQTLGHVKDYEGHSLGKVIAEGDLAGSLYGICLQEGYCPQCAANDGTLIALRPDDETPCPMCGFRGIYG